MMKKPIALLVLIFITGCGAEPPAGEKPSSGKNNVFSAPQVKAEILGWLSAYIKAEATKTHASGEHPVAQAEMSRHEKNLVDMKRTNLPLVKKVVTELHNQFHRDKAAVIQKRNRIQIVGRTLTPEEKKFVEETAPRQLQEISARDNAFHEFMKFFKK